MQDWCTPRGVLVMWTAKKAYGLLEIFKPLRLHGDNVWARNVADAST